MTNHSSNHDLHRNVPKVQSSTGSLEEVVNVKAHHALDLVHIWHKWKDALSDTEAVVLERLYGIQDEDTRTLEDVGEEIGITRERVRQIKAKALRKLKWVDWQYWRPVELAFEECATRGNYLFSEVEWEQWLDLHSASPTNFPRPTLFRLLCDVYSEYHYVSQYRVATFSTVTVDDLKRLENALNRLLRDHREIGLLADALVSEVHRAVSTSLTVEMRKPEFILKAVDIFERVGRTSDGTYRYLRKKKASILPSAKAAWPGLPGTTLFQWEQELRKQFETVDWIGQIRLTEDDFNAICRAVQVEAQSRNYFTGDLEGQPRLVPPAVFMTSMVLSARFAEHLPDEAVDEFWKPYLRTVWNTEYSQAFYARCKKQFSAAEEYLESTYRFIFPRVSASGEVVTPIFRHALLPRYMQTDFAEWLSKHWRSILAVADNSRQLVGYLQDSTSFDSGNYSHRLKYFVTGGATSETAASLILTMVAAISLHMNDGESIAVVDHLLDGSPIEQELWRQLSLTLHAENSQTSISNRSWTPRVAWAWSVEDADLVLRLQNVVISASSNLTGEVDRLVWIENSTQDPLAATVEVSVVPWRVPNGDRLIPDLYVTGVDRDRDGELVLLTDMDEVAMRLSVPALPGQPIQFFRLIQQGAYGIPTDVSQIKDGTYLICAKQAVTILEEDADEEESSELLPDFELDVPYLLDKRYSWAAQVTLTLPVTVVQGQTRTKLIAPTQITTTLPKPRIAGGHPINGLAPYVQPTFTSTQVIIHFDNRIADFPKQTVLWLHGQDGWRWHQSFVALQQQGFLTESDKGLQIDLSAFLPDKPNSYTVDLRIILQSLLITPLQFAVVPGMEVDVLTSYPLYTPATPFRIQVYGIEGSEIVRAPEIVVVESAQKSLDILWHDYRHSPTIRLRFNDIEISLTWNIPQAMVWLDPAPLKPYLTLHELRQTKLHIVSRAADVGSFRLNVQGQGERTFPLRRNTAIIQLGQSQVYDMIRLLDQQRAEVSVNVQGICWSIFEVRREPRLTDIQISYKDQSVHIYTGLDVDWTGSIRFLCQSVSNPFEATRTLGIAAKLTGYHQLPVPLADGVYQLQIQLDGTSLPIDGTLLRLVVGRGDDVIESSLELGRAIRSGSLISSQLAEDFVLWWADIANTTAVSLTPATQYQLATIASDALENFTIGHLKALWAPLAKLKEANQSSYWADKYGLLPAWIFLPTPIFLKTIDRERRLLVYPIEILEGGYRGRGYGRWRLLPIEDARKEFVYVQWKPVEGGLIQIEAGLPVEHTNDFAAIDLLDTYSLHFCTRCGQLTGARALPLPPQILEMHKHGHVSADVLDINIDEQHGGYRLLAEVFLERREGSLVDIFEQYGISITSTLDTVPEPSRSEASISLDKRWSEQLALISREILWYGNIGGEASLGRSISHLLARWSQDNSVSRFGQRMVGFGLLLRLAASNPNVYFRLLKRSGLSENDVVALLAELTVQAPKHVTWALTWAELLIRHSFGLVE